MNNALKNHSHLSFSEPSQLIQAAIEFYNHCRLEVGRLTPVEVGKDWKSFPYGISILKESSASLSSK